MNINIPGLGETTKDERFGWLYGPEIEVNVLGGKKCRLVIKGYEKDAAKEDFHTAISNFISAPKSVLTDASGFIFRYYQDINSNWSSEDEQFLKIAAPDEIWDYISLGNEPTMSRRRHGDKAIYISLECNCEWEPEHGLQIVFKDGLRVNKVGPYDGHLTNSDAYNDEKLENVVYR